MTIQLPLSLAAVVLLAGCNPQPGADNASADAETTIPANAAVANAAAPADDAAANAIHLTEKTDAIDFDYKIPSRAAAAPALRDHLLADAETGKKATIRDQAQYAKELPPDAPARPYGLEKSWSVVGETGQLLSLVAAGYVYTGGAHGSDSFETLVWDKTANRAVPFDALFTDKTKALATIRKPFCDTLNKERAKRRGGELGTADDWSTRCPEFKDHITLAFAKPVNGTFSRIGVYIPADIAGAHAEGSYTYDLAIPKEMISLIAPEWRASFPGG
ncbi:MAG TPA: DUF4163 domain-containing protein [Sphingomonas sp.]|nr:DUF4163 domain-containing protein [Sphingomonas sp.]